MTPFEQELSRLPLRKTPARWKAEILSQAVAPKRRVAAIFWPHPAAWGALAACWLVAGILSFSGPRGEALYSFTPPEYPEVRLEPGEVLVLLWWRDRMFETNTEEPEPYLDRNKL